MSSARTGIFLFAPTLNAGTSVAAALRSVADNLDDHLDVTVFLADGGSSDDTVEKATAFPFVHFLPGPDAGLYDGLNRALESGLRAARNEAPAKPRNILCGFLNADDVLPAGALGHVASAAQSNRSIDMFSGEPLFEHQGMSKSRLVHNRPLSLAGCLFGIPVINARFFRLSCLEKLGGFRPQAGLAADRDLLVRFVRHRFESMRLDAHTYTYRHNAGSKTLAGDDAARARIWQAERDLADFLAVDPGSTAREKTLSRRSAVISDLRRSLRSDVDFPNPRGVLRYGLAGLWNYMRWRGQSSGY